MANDAPYPEAEISFLLQASVTGVWFNPARAKGITFQSTTAPKVLISLKTKDPADPFGNKSGMVCEVLTKNSVTPDQAEFVFQLTEKQIFRPYGPNSSRLPYVAHGNEVIDHSGNIAPGRGVPFKLYPPDIQELVTRINAALLASMERFLALIRWQQDFEAPARMIQLDQLYWNTSGKSYKAVARPWQDVVSHSPLRVTWGTAHEAAIQTIWDADISEPLGHELLREAVSARHSPRGALLTAASALETAVKIHIGRIVPAASWLMQEIPSPPIDKILRNYFPILHPSYSTGLWTALKPTVKVVQRLIEARNKVAHAGTLPDNAPSLEECVTAVKDILYVLDVLDGHEWAKQLVSRQIGNAMSWPSRDQTSITMIFREE